MRLLQIISLVENVLGIYRNYLSFKKLSRKLICIRIIIEIILIIFNLIDFSLHMGDHLSFLLLFYLNATNSILIMLLAIHKGISYKKLLVYLKSFLLYFPTQAEQAKRIDNSQKVSLLLFLSYCLIKLLILLSFFPWRGGNSILLILNQIIPLVMHVCDARFLFEFYVMYCGVNTVANQLAFTINEIELETGKNNVFCEHNTIRISQSCKKRLRQVDKWSAAYATIKKCSELYNSTFGFQTFLMLSTTTVYYITLLYWITTMSLQGNVITTVQFISCLFEFMFALYVLSHAAQQVHNRAESLKQRLASLVIHSLVCEKQYEATRDFLRQVSTHPIRTTAYGSITIDMTLIPTCIAFSTSYAVIALQFNHIL